MSGRARLLMLITELQMGGAAKVVRELSIDLAKRYEVHEVVFNVADGVDFAGASPPHSLDVQGGGSILGKLTNLKERISRARRLKRMLGIDVSISHLEGAHWVDVLSRSREKTVLCVHGTILHNPNIGGASGWLRRRVVMPLIYNRADRVVTVSRDLVSELIALGVSAERIRTINNSFDGRVIADGIREPLSEDEEAVFGRGPVLVNVGRLDSPKNQQALLDVFAGLRRRRTLKLLILGDGKLREPLVAQAEALGLSVYRAWSDAPLTPEHDVYFLGIRSNPFKIVAQSDLFLMTSSAEGFPLALCEAMVCGVPVLSTDCRTGPREILAPETATPATPIASAEATRFGMLMPVLHEPSSAAAAQQVWTATILGLLDDAPARARMSKAARKRMQDFSREKIAAQWVELIEELTASPR